MEFFSSNKQLVVETPKSVIKSRYLDHYTKPIITTGNHELDSVSSESDKNSSLVPPSSNPFRKDY